MESTGESACGIELRSNSPLKGGQFTGTHPNEHVQASGPLLMRIVFWGF